MDNRIVFFLGPTASGKTDISIRMAEEFGGEIVCADSMQIYADMEIGTAAPTKEEKRIIPHHLFNYVEPSESYSVARYRKDAYKVIDSLLEKGTVPFVVGGSGLYLNSLMYELDLEDDSVDEELRASLEEEYDRDPEALYGRLMSMDPDSIKRIHLNDRKRVVRRMEILLTTKKENYNFRKKDPRYRSLKLMITKDREHLYSDIDRRVDLMVESGLLDEVKTIIDRYGTSSTAFQAIGYKELIPYLNGTEPLSKCIDDIKRASRNLAKRQLTWFRRDEEIITLNRDSFPSEEEFIKNTEERIKAFLDV
ncbi:MAG: tRNA (adenosine(37)-N6)-dimethylallyltransferase MiaA [Clostridia bacterium]|nr:tRNA (adenosine(37)-N6)-dimethylallyltransferase MiaA [Clostridia bacterium]